MAGTDFFNVSFPEYSVNVAYARRDDLEAGRALNLAREESVREAYNFFLSFREEFFALGFEDDKNNFGFDYYNEWITYQSFGFENYYAEMLKYTKPVSYVLREDFPVLALVGFNKRTAYGSDPRTGSTYATSIDQLDNKDTLKNLVIVKTEIECYLENNGVEPSMKNFLRFWELDSFAITKFSCARFTMYSDEEKEKFRQRILDLIRHSIVLEDCFTALSWYGNMDYDKTHDFTHSVDAIAGLREAPLSFRNYFYFASEVSFNDDF